MKKRRLLLIALAAFCFASAGLAQMPSYVPTNGLVGWWPFNGNANDESGNGNDGIVTSALLTSDRDNIINSAYNFDFTGKTFGSLNKEIYLPYSPNFNTSDLTVSVWVCPRSYYWPGDINNPNSSIITRFQYGYSNPNGQVWGIDFNANSFKGFILAPSTQNNQTSAVVISNTPLTLNQWHHIVMTYNGAVLKLYLNGNLVSSTNTTLTLNASGNSGISVGVSNQANGYWQDADAMIDDIGIWKRALTPCEIVSLYIGQTPLTTQPTTACYETATFNSTTCQWDVTGTQATQPTTACYETATFNTTTCQWNVTGTQATQPTTACYETATFNSTTCQWDVTGTQATQPTTACYETATFNSTTCQWDVTGTQATQPTTACYETATFNSTTCQWDVTGTQATQPTTACYETATFNSTTCQWDVTGNQATQPTTACYETATFNSTTCQWDVTGTQATQPTTACYETATFNSTTCQWDVTGTQTNSAEVNVTSASCGNINGVIAISNIIGGTAPYQVSINGLPLSSNLNFTNLQGGNYSITIEDANGCQYNTSAIIGTTPNPTANFGLTQNTIKLSAPYTSALNMSSSDAINYYWTSYNSIPTNSIEENPSFDFTAQQPGNYAITLIVENSDGCRDTVTNLIEIEEDLLIFVPNSFTPDGNEINNTWNIITSSIDIMDFKVLIFNRWGEIIWESNDPSVGWDGTYMNRKVENDIYTWTLSVKDKKRSEVVNLNGFVNVQF